MALIVLANQGWSRDYTSWLFLETVVTFIKYMYNTSSSIQFTRLMASVRQYSEKGGRRPFCPGQSVCLLACNHLLDTSTELGLGRTTNDTSVPTSQPGSRPYMGGQKQILLLRILLNYTENADIVVIDLAETELQNSSLPTPGKSTSGL